MNRTRSLYAKRVARRGGATLTEVLMALLVMGIGLVSVATLFPLSLLRSVEATKLTNATIARENAEARIKASVWRDGFGNPIQRAIVEDPDKDGDIREHDATKFVFDPLGAMTFAGDNAKYANGTALATSFGGQDANGDGILEAPIGVSRFNFGIGTIADARSFVTLPDSFVNVADMLAGAVSISGTTLTIANGGPVLDEYVGQTVRVTAINTLGTASVVLSGTVPNGANVQTIPLSGGLPGGFELGRVTIEVPEQRYTWLATVRRYGVKPSVTIVVFFRRFFSAEDEQVFNVNEPAGSYNEFELPTKVDPASPTGALLRPPGMHVGGYMFDVNTFRWLKIASVTDVKTGAGAPLVRFTTDAEDIDPLIQPRVNFPAMFPRNVVEAYTLKKD